jgi:hypothetical protein
MDLPDVFVTVMVESTRNARVAKLRRTVAAYSAVRLMLVALTEPGTSPSATGVLEGAGVETDAVEAAIEDWPGAVALAVAGFVTACADAFESTTDDGAGVSASAATRRWATTMDGIATRTAIRAILWTAPGDRLMPASYGGGLDRSTFSPHTSGAVVAA